jgi:hypothetical protein
LYNGHGRHGKGHVDIMINNNGDMKDNNDRPWTAPSSTHVDDHNNNERVLSGWRSPPLNNNMDSNRFNLFDATTGLTFTSIRATTPIISITEGTYRAGAQSSHDHRFMPPSPNGISLDLFLSLLPCLSYSYIYG